MIKWGHILPKDLHWRNVTHEITSCVVEKIKSWKSMLTSKGNSSGNEHGILSPEIAVSSIPNCTLRPCTARPDPASHGLDDCPSHAQELTTESRAVTERTESLYIPVCSSVKNCPGLCSSSLLCSFSPSLHSSHTISLLCVLRRHWFALSPPSQFSP